MNSSFKSFAETTIIHKKKWLKPLSVTLCATILTACQSIPRAQTEPVIARPSVPLHSGERYRLDINDQVTPSIAAIGWQNFYSDEKLKSLIQLGLDNNKNIRQSILAIEKAQAQYRITDNSDLPHINGNASYNRVGNARGADDSYNVRLAAASYELDFWGKIASLKDQALQNYLATSVASDTAKVSLIANIASSYVNLSYQLAQLNLAQGTLNNRKESLRITKARLEAGIDSKAPSLQAEAAVEEARIALLNAQSGVLKAQNALQFLVGTPIPDNLLPEPAVKNIVSSNVLSPGLPSDLLRFRPDVLEAEYRLKAAGANIEVARTAYYPSISLTGNLGYSSTDLSDLFTSGASSWSFGPSISIPLFDAGRRDADYQVAQIEREQAVANYENAIETAFREVNDVLAERATLESRKASQYRLQDNYKEIFTISYERFKAQVDDYLSVLDSERSLFSTQRSILNMELESLTNQIALYKVLGGGANLLVPREVPTPEHRNLVNIMQPQTDADKVAIAMKATSAPEFVYDEENDNYQKKPTTIIEPTSSESENN